MVIGWVTWFQYIGLDISALYVYQYAVIKVAVVSIEEKYMIFDRGCAAYVGELGHVFKPPVYIYIPI